MSDGDELEAKRSRLHVAREAHRAAVAELERLERKPRVSAMALDIARQRVDVARRELIGARRGLLRPI